MIKNGKEKTETPLLKSKANTENVTNMSCMFSNCSSLKSLPDISKWDTKNVNNIRLIFMIVAH